MKNSLQTCFLCVSATSLLAGFALAEYPLPLDGTPYLPSRPHGDYSNIQSLSPAQRAGKVIGMDVRNQQNDKLGSVEDLGVAMADARITAVILSSGGFLGIGDELSIIPPQSFRADPENNLLKIDLTKDQLSAAPRFQSAQWPDLNDRAYMKTVYDTYKVEAWFNGPDKNKEDRMGVMKASDILKMDVWNNQGEKVGEVKDLVLSDDLSRISSVVVSIGGFLGAGDEWSVLPPQQFKFTPEGKSLALAADKETLNKAPRFKPNSWPEQLNAPSYLGRIYDPFKGRARKTPTASDQSNDSRDVEMTRVIRKSIVAEDNLSFTAKNIKVITAGGNVTLVGQVKSADEARMLLDIANKHAGADRVTNQIEVKK